MTVLMDSSEEKAFVLRISLLVSHHISEDENTYTHRLLLGTPVQSSAAALL